MSTPAIARMVTGTRNEAFVAPRCGAGARYGASVSTSRRSSGTAASASRSSRAFLKVTVPAKLKVVAALDALTGHRQVTGEAVQDRALGRALLVEDAQHVGVGVAVVDLQGLAEPLGEVDVPAEAVLLDGHALGAGAEVVEAGLTDDADAIVGRAPLDLGVSPRPARPLGRQPWNLVGVQGDSADQLVVVPRWPPW